MESSIKKKNLYRLKIVKKEVISYNSRMIIYKMESILLTIYNFLKEIIIYYKEWIKFNIAEIGYYNIIFGIL